MRPASATPEVIDQILVIGQKRQPNEACGVILPHDLVVELPNVAKNPTEAYEIDNEDLVKVLVPLLQSEDEGDLQRSDIIIWHTHPSGSVGPSEADMMARASGFRYLVVAVPSGKATQF